MILNAAARQAYSKAIKLDAAIDARVIRVDGSGTPTTAKDGEALKDSAERAWADYREAKDAQVEDDQIGGWVTHEEALEIVFSMMSPPVSEPEPKLEQDAL